MITFDVTFDGKRPGMKLFAKRMQKLTKKQIPMFKKKVLSETGKRCKRYMVQNIDGSGASFRGKLRSSIHRRTMKDRVSVEVWHGGAMALEAGYRPHYIHRNMMSGGGYKVGDWMDAHGMKNRNYVLVGYGPTAQGIHFVENAYNRINAEFPTIIKHYLKELKR